MTESFITRDLLGREIRVEREMPAEPVATAGTIDRDLGIPDPVKRAAHLFGCYNLPRAAQLCEEEGISVADAEAGFKLADERRINSLIHAQVYGSPEYGGPRK